MSRHSALRSLRQTAVAMALPLLLAACGGGGDTHPAPSPTPPTAPAVTLDATAGASQLLAGGTTTLSATASDNSAITWQLAAGAPGKLSATTGASVTYTAPATGIAVPTAVSVTATAAGIDRIIQLVVNPEPGGAGLSLIAGAAGSHALADGDAATARFHSITDIAPAAGGSWLVIDKRATALRRVTVNGIVSTIVSQSDEVDSAGALLAVAADTEGSAWTVQQLRGGPVLRKVAANGTMTTLSGPQPQLDGTRRLLAGNAGEVYALVVSEERSGIFRVSENGAVTLLAGSGGGGLAADGQGAAARFPDPTDITRLPDGDFYVTDGRFVRHVTAAGRVTTLLPRDAATGAGLPATATLRSITARPGGTLALLAWLEDRYVIYDMTPGGALTTRYAAPRIPAGRGMTEFDTLRAAPDGTLVVANAGELRMLRGAALVPLAGLENDSATDVDGVGAAARFVDPLFVASDQRGRIYVADHPTGYGDIPGSPADHGLYLRQIDAAGNVTTLLTKADFGRPRGLLADSAGNVYVLEQARCNGRLDTPGGAVYRIAPGGTLTPVAGLTAANNPRPLDGKGTQARFARPTFAGIAPDGTLYVHDVDNTIRQVAQDGTVTTVAALPADVGVAPDGKRYGYDGSTVYRIEADGSRTRIAGEIGREGTVLGTLPGALSVSGGRASLPGLLTPTGLHTFAVISDGAIVKLVVPH